MQVFAYKRGQTSIVLRVEIMNNAGALLTGLSSASAGLILSTIADNEASATAYTQAGSSIEGITTLGTYEAPTATKCRFKEVDSTNHPGLYEIHLADARFAVASAKGLTLSLSGVAGMGPNNIRVNLVDDDPYTAKGTAQTGDAFARLGAPAGASLSADIAALQDTADSISGFTDTAAQAAQVTALADAVEGQNNTWFANFISPGGGGRAGSF